MSARLDAEFRDGEIILSWSGGRLEVPARELLVRAGGARVRLTAQDLHAGSGLATIPASRGGTQAFHALSAGASVADYVAFVLTRPDLALPVPFTALMERVRAETAVGRLTPSSLSAALSRDRRFLSAGGGRWTLSGEAWAALEGVREQCC